MRLQASIVVPTRNRADVLSGCLASLTRQTLEAANFEVLVIDNGSTDDTAAVAARFSTALQLQYAVAAEPGLHVARHEGMRRARTDLLLFVDDDIEATPGWAEAVVHAFTDPDVVLVGGNNHPLFESTPPSWLQRWWDQPVHKGRALGYLSILDFGEGSFDVDPGYVWGCNFSVRREVLDAAGGFHPDSLPRDQLRLRGDGETHVSATIRESGLRARFDSRASVHHRVDGARMQPGYIEQRAFAQGISDSYSGIRRHGGLPPWRQDAVPRLLRRSRSLLRQSLYHFRATDQVARDLASVQAAAQAAWRRGYAFHRQQVRDDPALLAWVLQGDYLE